MFDIHIHVHKTIGESQVAELAAKLEELKAAIVAEQSEVAAEVAGLAAKIDELKAACEAGHIEKANLLAELDAIKAGVEGIFTPPAPEPAPEPTPEPTPE